MFIFFLQLRDTLHGGRLYVFTILVALTWALWAIKVHLSRRYQPWVGDYHTTASVVIPVVTSRSACSTKSSTTSPNSRRTK